MDRWAWGSLNWFEIDFVSPFPALFLWSLMKWCKCVFNKYLSSCLLLASRKKWATLKHVTCVVKAWGQLWMHSELQDVWQLQVSLNNSVVYWCYCRKHWAERQVIPCVDLFGSTSTFRLCSDTVFLIDWGFCQFPAWNWLLVMWWGWMGRYDK